MLPFILNLHVVSVLLNTGYSFLSLTALFSEELGDLAKLTVTLACTDVKSDLTNSRVAAKLLFNY